MHQTVMSLRSACFCVPNHAEGAVGPDAFVLPRSFRANSLYRNLNLLSDLLATKRDRVSLSVAG